MDKNGVRSPKGNYCPNQPKHIDFPPEVASALCSKPAQEKKQASMPASRQTAQPVKAGPSGIPAKKGTGGAIIRFLFQLVVVPCAKPIAEKYIVPWLTDKFGEFFCQFTGWEPDSVQKPEVIYDTTDYEYVSDDEESPVTEEYSAEEDTPAEEGHSCKVYRFPA